MPKLRVGNAPCSRGTLDFDQAAAEQVPFGRLDAEIARLIQADDDWK